MSCRSSPRHRMRAILFCLGFSTDIRYIPVECAVRRTRRADSNSSSVSEGLGPIDMVWSCFSVVLGRTRIHSQRHSHILVRPYTIRRSSTCSFYVIKIASAYMYIYIPFSIYAYAHLVFNIYIYIRSSANTEDASQHA